MNLADLATIAASLATLATVILTVIDRRRARRERERHEQPPNPIPRSTDPQEAPRAAPVGPQAAPSAWGQPTPAVDTGQVATDGLSVMAYLFGLLAALPLLFVRRRAVRYHALQSLGIDVLTVLYLIVGTVLGVTWSIIRYGDDPIPENDPVLTAFVIGIFVVELLPRLYCIVQILRSRPARVPLVWRLAATMAGRVQERRPPPPSYQGWGS